MALPNLEAYLRACARLVERGYPSEEMELILESIIHNKFVEVPFNENDNLIYEAMEVTDMKVIKNDPLIDADGLSLKINGKEYRYISPVLDAKQLHIQLTRQGKHNWGRAIAWLKKNSTQYFGGKRGLYSEVPASGRLPEPESL